MEKNLKSSSDAFFNIIFLFWYLLLFWIYDKFIQLIQAIDTYVWFVPLPTQTTLYWNKKFRNKIKTQNKKYMYSRKHCRVLMYSFKSEELNSVANRYVA